jgi:hypothetical protein
MQGHDTDRVHMGDKDYSVVCWHCGNTFEATRSDASFCSAKCRVAHSREPQKLLNAIEELHDMRFRIIQIAEKYKGNAEVIKALEILKSNVASAEYICEYIP